MNCENGSSEDNHNVYEVSQIKNCRIISILTILSDSTFRYKKKTKSPTTLTKRLVECHQNSWIWALFYHLYRIWKCKILKELSVDKFCAVWNSWLGEGKLLCQHEESFSSYAGTWLNYHHGNVTGNKFKAIWRRSYINISECSYGDGNWHWYAELECWG